MTEETTPAAIQFLGTSQPRGRQEWNIMRYPSPEFLVFSSRLMVSSCSHRIDIAICSDDIHLQDGSEVGEAIRSRASFPIG
jgi:hypothetical protein